MARTTNILNKRIPREFKSNLSRYLALFFLVALCIYIVVSLIAASDIVIETVSDNAETSNREDGYFTTLVPLTNDQVKELESEEISLEATFSLDYRLEDDSIIRVFKQRESINLEQVDLGHVASDGELVLEKLYADANGYEPGSSLNIGNTTLVVAGIGSSPDYDFVVQKLSDTAADKHHFGTAFVTPRTYELLQQNENALQQEENLYTFRLNDAMSASDLRDHVRDASFDRDQIIDEFFLELLDKAEGPQNELLDALDDLQEGTKELADGSTELDDASDEFASGVHEVADGASELSAGASTITSGLSTLSAGIQSYQDTLFGQASELEGSVSGFSSEQAVYEQALQTYVLTFAAVYGTVIASGADEVSAMQTATSQTTSEATAMQSALKAMMTASGADAGYTAAAEALRQAASSLGSSAQNESVIGGMLALSTGAASLSSGANELSAGTKTLAEASNELSDGATSLAEGSADLNEGTGELSDAIKELLDELSEGQISNLTGFVEAQDNPRIDASADDVVITKVTGLIAGIIIIILFVYVISVFVVHSIDRESEVIGALYALGIQRSELIRHYLTLPLLITFVGGAVGLVAAYSPLGVDVQLADSTTYYSFPDPSLTILPYQIIYGIVIPPVLALIIAYLVIRKRLHRSPLVLLRKEQAEVKTSNFSLQGMKFANAFRLRQILREKRSAFAIGGGIFLSMLLVMLSLNCYSFITTMAEQNEEDMKFEYLVALKYPPEIKPAGTEAVYLQSLHQEAYGYQNEVSIMGIDNNNPYFDFIPAKGKQTLTISTSTASKFRVGVGDPFILEDKINDREYRFTIDAIVPYSVGLYVFMDIDSMRDLFEAEEDAYNALLSETMPDIEEGRIASVTSKSDILEYAEVFMEMIASMFIMLLVVSALVFVMVLYLMMKVMIDRATTGISLVKIFGYNNHEVRTLYLDGTFWTVVVFTAISIPLAKLAMNQLWPYLIANVAIGPDLSMKPWLYGAIIVFVLVAYLAIMFVLMRRVTSISPNEILKDRE